MRFAAAPARGPERPPPLPELVERCRERRLAMVLAAAGLATFGLAAALDPYDGGGLPRTHGTHRQLGLPPCTLRAVTGVGCPSCGMTTAFALLMHGDPMAAWRTNWAGCVVAALALAGTAWFLLVACGLPPGRMTADAVVTLVAMVGTTVATIRWVSMLWAAGLAAW